MVHQPVEKVADQDGCRTDTFHNRYINHSDVGRWYCILLNCWSDVLSLVSIYPRGMFIPRASVALVHTNPVDWMMSCDENARVIAVTSKSHIDDVGLYLVSEQRVFKWFEFPNDSVFKAPASGGYEFVFEPNGFYGIYDSTSGYLQFRIYCASNSSDIGAIRISGGAQHIAYGKHEEHIVTVGSDRMVRFWSLRTGRHIAELAFRFEGVSAIVVTPDGRNVVLGTFDGSIHVLSAHNGGEHVMTMRSGRDTGIGHESEILSMVVMPDGKRLASASTGGTVRVWSMETGEELQRLYGHSSAVHCLCLSVTPEGEERLFGAARRGVVYVWCAPLVHARQELADAELLLSIVIDDDEDEGDECADPSLLVLVTREFLIESAKVSCQSMYL